MTDIKSRLGPGPSIERQARSALRRAAFWRLAATIPALLSGLLSCVARVFTTLADWMTDIEHATNYMELDAARRYQLLTGVDLAMAAGDDARYEMLDPKAQEREREGVAEEDDDE